jgi:predicted MFS family arabinose efflux permease
MTPSPAYPSLLIAVAVWGLGAALYLIGFFQRVAPAVLTRELSTEFALTAAALGNLSAVYFYSYVAMQIPTGLLADHWGPRRTLALGGTVAAAGAALFGLAESYTLVVLGRLLVGGAVGVAFVSMLKLSTHWFDHSRFAAIAGVAVATGVVGAVSAGAPLRLAADAFGWRHVMVASGAVTALVAIATWLVVRDDPRDRGYRSYMPQGRPGVAGHSVLGGLRICFRSRNTWGACRSSRPTTGSRRPRLRASSPCSSSRGRPAGRSSARCPTGWANASRSTSSAPQRRSSAGSS